MNNLAIAALQSTSRVIFPHRLAGRRCLSLVGRSSPSSSFKQLAAHDTRITSLTLRGNDTSATQALVRRRRYESLAPFRRHFAAASSSSTDPPKSPKRSDEKAKTAAEDEPQSQAERYLKYLQMDMAAEQDDREQRIKLVPRQDAENVDTSYMTRAKAAVLHLYHGFRLFGLETRVAARLGMRKLKGQVLSRSEQRQFERTLVDVFRMVPFSLFIIIPMAELLLPVAIWLFPNMMPSAFIGSTETRRRIQAELDSKIQFAQFLQRTLEEIPLEVKAGGVARAKTAEFKRFMHKIHEEGGYVSKSELLKWMPFFAENMTLEVLSVSQLRALCRLLQVRIMPFSTPASLRLQLKIKIYNLRLDDKVIMLEGGVNSLNVARLQEACRERGMRALGMSEERLKQQLLQWMELSQNEKVPEAFLLLSRAFYFPEEVQYTDRLKSILSHMPVTVKQEAEQRLAEMEGKKDHKARRELILAIEQQLKSEREAEKVAAAAAEADKIKEAEKEEQEMLVAEQHAAHDRLVPLQVSTKSVKEIIKEQREMLAVDGDHLRDIAVELDVQDGVEEKRHITIEKEDLDAIGTVLLKAAAVREAREDLEELRKDADEHAEELVAATNTARRQGVRVRQTALGKRLTQKVDSMVEHLNQMVDKVDTTPLDDGEEEGPPPVTVDKTKASLSTATHSMTVTELMTAIGRLKEGLHMDEKRMARVQEVLATFDDDADGVIDIDLALDVIQLIGVEDVKIDSKQMGELIGMMRREEELNTRLEEDMKRVEGQKKEEVMEEEVDTTPLPIDDAQSQIRVDPFIPPAPMDKGETSKSGTK